jgi:hypothetical protein
MSNLAVFEDVRLAKSISVNATGGKAATGSYWSAQEAINSIAPTSDSTAIEGYTAIMSAKLTKLISKGLLELKMCVTMGIIAQKIIPAVRGSQRIICLALYMCIKVCFSYLENSRERLYRCQCICD